ncbi:MAG: MATE family efflux transporter [Saprospiraceae bacterium]|nr:MATE family efflux transporter [Saprospiraceae bacterium]
MVPRDSKNNNRTLREEAYKTLRIGIPVIVAQLLQMAMNFVDTVMAGNLSALDLAAIAVGGAIYIPFILMGGGVVMAITPIVAQLFGARNLKDIGRNVIQGLWLSQMLAVPIFFIIRNLGIVMELMEVEPRIVPLALGYLDAISWGIFPMFAYMSLRFFNEGLSVTRPGMYIALIGVLFNIPGNYVLMYGALGFPRMGAVGCGYASALVALVMFVCMLAFTSTFQPYNRFKLFHSFRMPEWPYLKEVLSIGIPIGVSSGMEVTMFAIVSLLMGSLGTNAVAGHQVALNFAALAFMVPLGLSTAITTRVGNAVGAGSLREARKRGFLGIGMSVAFMSVTALVMYLFPEWIAGIYTDDPEVIEVAAGLLLMAAIFQVSDGLQVSGFGALKGLKETKIPMYVNLVSYWGLGLPLGYFLGIVYSLGPQGLWIGLIAGLSLAGLLHNARFHVLTRR